MDTFCDGQLWNSSLLLDNTWPQFTDCFMHTVLIWLPCGFLGLSLPCYVTSVRRNATHIRFRTTTLFGARLCCCLTLAVLVVLHVLMRTCGLTISTSPAAFLGDALYLSAYMTLCVMTQYERVQGVHTSTVPFLFWLMASLCNVIPLYSVVIQQRYESHPVSFTLCVVSHALQICSLLLTALVNNHQHTSHVTHSSQRPCPETTCSFPSYLAFWWMTELMIKGHKRDLQASDLWQLPPAERSDTLTARFTALWREQRAVRGFHRNAERSSKTRETVGERTPLLASVTSPRHTGDTADRQKEGGRSPGMLRTLLCMMAKDMVAIVMMKVISDVFFLLCPLLMGMLMGYLSTRPADRLWQGYALCAAMLVSLTLKSLLFAHSMFRAARVGIRMKSTLIAAIYEKALTMSQETRKRTTVGEIVNLMSVDAQRVQDVMIVCFYAATGPLQFLAAVILLYFTIGPAIFVGVLLFLCCIPLNAYVISRQRRLQSSNLGFKDARLRLFHEILNGIKVLKLYAWEPSFRQKIGETRLKEVGVLFKMALLNTLMSLCWEMVPFLVTLVTLMTYVLMDETNQLDAGKAFVSLSLFNILRQPLAVLSRMIMYFIMVQVSIKRIRSFLVGEDLDPDAVQRNTSSDSVLTIQDGTFTWSSQQSPVLQHINLQVGQGKLVAVVGPVGCGKSSLISAILGEMEKVKGTVTLTGRIAYVPQQAWIRNTTVRDNILFGSAYIRAKYQAVLDLCELERDVTILPTGDLTEIGEKGINLSGGQKQRVSVARAVYSDSDVYLLDDPLSAVDSHVGKAIFSKVIGPNGVLKKKTRVLVTHGVHWLPMVDEIIVMTDGSISERGSYEQLMSHDGPFAQFLKNYLTEVFEVEEQEDPEIAEIHGKMRERLGSVTSYASSDDDSLKLSFHRAGHRRANVSDNSDSFDSTTRRETASRHSRTPPRRPEKQRAMIKLQGVGAGVCDVEDSLTISPSSQGDEAAIEADQCSTDTLPAGKVPLSVFLYYARAVGLVPLMLAVLSFCLYQALSVGANLWLKKWTGAAHTSSPQDDNVTCDHRGCDATGSHVLANYTVQHNIRAAGGRKETYFCLTIYGVLGLGQVLFLTLFNALYWTRMAHAAQVLHSRLVDNLMRAPMAFFDTTPIGRILNRLSFDVETVDNALPIIIRDWLVTFVLVMVTLMVMVMHTPLSVIVMLPVAVIYFFCQRFYVPTTRQLRRLECVSRSPIFALFSETVGGASSIRAYDVTTSFLEESKRRVDCNQVFFFASQAAMRWMQWNLDALAAVLVTAVCIFVITSSTTTAADAGLCISYALQISGSLTWMTRQMGELQSNIVSVERLKEYSVLENEADWEKPDTTPDPNWPQRGEVVFQHFYMRYRPGLDLVLKEVTFTINHGEKVGIVGRTGAGKSSLTLALFRLIEAAGGCILIDGVNIADMGLHDLRSRLTILPQDPVLFSGTLRMNLDPFDEYRDDQLWTALERAHLRHSVLSLPGQLAFQCGEEGGNLSVGQRQLVCLARTLLRRTKILVLDEATAAVDMETDALIQDTIRSAFSSCTIITIAHRLNTIMDYDRVMVMDAGQVKEFAPPGELLSNKKSEFYAMMKDAGLV
ncbi:ATP-binding cassette sub-family C member 3-like [Babylonia areolata]|uniref:ATP-binding cassette sub-family C member 3-like n=1 Tax=Babylonia areolata TaxID=304850 RepID=UPI003FD473DC